MSSEAVSYTHLDVYKRQDYINETYYREELGQKFYYSLQSFSGALYNIYRAWIERNTVEEPEEMATVLCGMFQN